MPMRRVLLSLAILVSLPLAGCASSSSSARHLADIGAEHRVVGAVLDDFHDAASKADGQRYFAHFTSYAIFLGTDDTERWSVEQFRAYAEPYFSKGQGWTYTPVERQVYFDQSWSVAWFDEKLDNEKWGRCRGSGVLVREGETWKITQYNLTAPIPNDLFPEVTQRIRSWSAQQR